MSGRGEDSFPLGLEDIEAIIQLLKESGWRQARIRIGDFELTLSDEQLDAVAPAAVPPSVAREMPPVPTPAPSSATHQSSGNGDGQLNPEITKPTSADATGVVVRAHSMGLFWRSPQPGAPPFVELGDEVEIDTPLGIVEVMKMMTQVQPGVRGIVAEIHVDDGDVVEFDQPLITIQPA